MSRVVFLSKNNGRMSSCESPAAQLMDFLIEKTKVAGKVVSSKEISEDPEAFKKSHYEFYYGSFDKAARIAYDKINPQRQATRKKKLREEKEVKEEHVVEEVKEETGVVDDVVEETDTEEEIQISKHVSDSNEITVDVVINLPDRKPIKFSFTA